jgi:hypothetical protein
MYKNKVAINKISFANANAKGFINSKDYDFIYLEDSFVKNNKEELPELIQNKNALFAGKEYFDLLSLYNDSGEVDEDSLVFLAKWCFTRIYGNLVIGDVFILNLQGNMKEKYNAI